MARAPKTTNSRDGFPSEEQMLAEVLAEMNPAPEQELSPRQRFEQRLSELTDELAVAAFEQDVKTLSRLEAERTAVQLELDRLVAAERGRLISERRAWEKAKAEQTAEAKERQRVAKEQLELVLSEADKHLAAWANSLDEQFDLGIAAGDRWVHETIVRRLQRAIFRGMQDTVGSRRVLEAFGSYPDARTRKAG